MYELVTSRLKSACVRPLGWGAGTSVPAGVVPGSRRRPAKRPRRSSRRDENGDITTPPETGINPAVQTPSRTAVGNLRARAPSFREPRLATGAAAQPTSNSPQTRLHLTGAIRLHLTGANRAITTACSEHLSLLEKHEAGARYLNAIALASTHG